MYKQLYPDRPYTADHIFPIYLIVTISFPIHFIQEVTL